ncbi:MAG: glycosyltransferase family 4 protein [Firmicutes bacterium]|nr:glycosyltransferase family 4 protein [Bacillota bacterium]
MRVALIAPGLAPLPPAPATSVEIYLYDLWRHLPARVDASLYARQQVAILQHGSRSRALLSSARGTHYLSTVLRHILSQKLGRTVIQVDNRPLSLPLVRRQFADPLLLNLHSMTFVDSLATARVRMTSALSVADRIVVNSAYVANRLTDSFAAQSSRVRVIYPGVDASAFHPSRTAAEFAARRALRMRLQSNGRTVILFVGRVVQRKGLHIVLEALRQIRRQSVQNAVVLWVAGKRPDAASPYGKLLTQLARGVRVHWLGYVLRSDLPDLYRAADLFVCPSQKPEAFGLVNLEAQASGLPVVASQAWGIRESVQNRKTGLLVPDFASSEAWATMIEELYQDRDQQRELSAKAVKWTQENFSWQGPARRFTQAYEDLLR